MILWHNPRCSKSRQTLTLLEENGHAPEIRKYLEDVPTVAELRAAADMLGLPVIAMMRVKEAAFKDKGLSKDSDAETLLTAMADAPKLIERPILFANGKATIGRPPEQVLEIL
ncbi:Arsenate reductase [Pelagimonas phthalicica]|uniref:Arsenate reductase n=1 Tax=Pelagimonas phthalicica TaxID=1037362 RepID=A0A238JII7_9RHOB|nr:arsenate reductase (glutaredoxin) [Pelagimonas phthalicica]TDS90025.1 arsenate reductase [Pelagimonas phthalicica]SMX30193.1 Arsenate reductase [Pelagimonas phthalicica]